MDPARPERDVNDIGSLLFGDFFPRIGSSEAKVLFLRAEAPSRSDAIYSDVRRTEQSMLDRARYDALHDHDALGGNSDRFSQHALWVLAVMQHEV